MLVSFDAPNDQTTLYVYVDGDSTPDMRITLFGDHSAIGAADLVF